MNEHLLTTDRMPKIIIRENGEDMEYQLKNDITTIGRSDDNDIVLGDLSSSRRHCQVVYRDRQWELVDLDSRNGTLVNGILVMQKELAPGDVIEIGRTHLFFQKIKQEPVLPTMRLDTSYFLDPVAAMNDDQKYEAFQRERTVFLRVLEVVKLLNTKRDLKAVLRIILELLLDLTEYEHGLVLLSNEQSGNFTLRAFRKLDAENAGNEAGVVARALTGILIEAGGPLICSDFESDKRFFAFGDLASLYIKSFLCLPFLFEDEIIGFMFLDNHRQARKLTEQQVRLAEILSAQAAIAIRNARLFEWNRRREQELELARRKMENLSAQLKEQIMNRVESLEEAVSIANVVEKPSLKHDYSDIITASPKVYKVLEVVDKVVDSSVPVLIEGESGTGKELIARALHFNSFRAKEKFVSENCAAVPANLLESEFFGHEKGAFTGANRQKKGLFELANNGTLFLDEIGDMPLEIQSKFLRALQNGEIRRVGGNQVINVNVRVVSATNQNLKQLIQKGTFREDLYYRLNVITVKLPPLRERKEDVPLLIQHFLGRIAQKQDAPVKEVHPQALQLLQSHDWPGNVRELENEIERMAALSRETITVDHIGAVIHAAVNQKNQVHSKPLREIVKRAVEEIEEDVISSVLQESGWKKTTTATILGISRPTLDNKITKYRIKRKH